VPAASLFRELWRLEPLADDWKMRWRMEMEWLLSVSDYIVEFVPSWQTFPDGTTLEVRTYQHISILYQVLLLVVSTCRALCHPSQLLLCCPLEHCFDLMSTIIDFDVGDGEPAPLRSSHKSSSFAHIGYHAIGNVTTQFYNFCSFIGNGVASVIFSGGQVSNIPAGTGTYWILDLVSGSKADFWLV